MARFLYLFKVEGIYTVAELMTRYGLKIGNRFPLMNDEVTGVFYICSAIRPVFVG